MINQDVQKLAKCDSRCLQPETSRRQRSPAEASYPCPPVLHLINVMRSQAAVDTLYQSVHTHTGPRLSSMCVCPFFLPLSPLIRVPGPSCKGPERGRGREEEPGAQCSGRLGLVCVCGGRLGQLTGVCMWGAG